MTKDPWTAVREHNGLILAYIVYNTEICKQDQYNVKKRFRLLLTYVFAIMWVGKKRTNYIVIV